MKLESDSEALMEQNAALSFSLANSQKMLESESKKHPHTASENGLKEGK
jgi:hypothetical protein